MTIIESMPDDPQLWAGWLEKQVVGKDLLELVEELRPEGVAVDSIGTPASITLASICGDKLPAVWRIGLSALEPAQIAQLLDHPELLFELQDQAFEACSSYWDGLVASQEINVPAVTPQHPNLSHLKSESIESHRGEAARPNFNGTETSGNDATVNQVRGEIGDRPTRTKLWAYLAMAAAVLLAVGYWFKPAPQKSGWGLAQVVALSPDLKDSTFLKQLSDLAGQWNNRQPANSDELLTRLKEYREGCKTLIEHPKPQLKPDDQRWLVEKCEKWLNDLDAVIGQLEQEQIAFTDAVKAANAIADKMKQVLQDKALELS